MTLLTAKPSGNGKLTDAELRAAELVIMENPTPRAIDPQDLMRLMAADPILHESKLLRIPCRGGACADDSLCDNCVAQRRYVALEVHRLDHGKPVHASDRAGYDVHAAKLRDWEEQAEVPEADDDPHRLARLYLNDTTHPDGLTVRYWRDEFHRWDGSAFRVMAVSEVNAELSQICKKEFDRLARLAREKWETNGKGDSNGKPSPAPVAKKVTGKLVADVRNALAGMTLLPGSIEAPAWLTDYKPFPAADAIVFRNGILNASGWIERAAPLIHSTPRLFVQGALDFDFIAKPAPPAAWLDFLLRLWPNDPESIELLREWFGYNLLPDTVQQKILLMVGPKRSGKGTIARVLRALVGERNYVSPTLAGLGLNFGLWPLVNKTTAVISDARMSGRTDAAVVAERLLSISGEDAQTIDRKFLPPITCKLPVRFTVLTNELPRLGDSSGALAGRFLILRLTQSWYGREDHKLTERLLSERAGILAWSLEGLRSLRTRGRFIQPQSAGQLVQDLEDLSSPIGAFVKDCCEVGNGFEVDKDVIYQRYRSWCETAGRDHPDDRAVFGRNLRAAVPSVEDAQRRETGKRWRVYEGIRCAELPPAY